MTTFIVKISTVAAKEIETRSFPDWPIVVAGDDVSLVPQSGGLETEKVAVLPNLLAALPVSSPFSP